MTCIVHTKDIPDFHLSTSRVAVLIPCYNEGRTIAKVVSDFRQVLPGATIYVYDNNSTDDTISRAVEAGGVIRRETLQGKGNVVRRMFADVEADIYLLIDGDDTYDVSRAPMLIERLREDYLDMVVASRPRRKEVAYRQGHSFGNALLTSVVNFLFGRKLKDMLSGYRVFSRRFVKSFPSLASGFEIETELTVHTLELRLPFEEVEVEHRERPIGSFSKLRTVRDGLRICWTILVLVKEIRPLLLFGSTAGLLALSSVALSIPLFATYLETGLVPRFPTAILCTGLILLAFLNAGSGIVLSSMSRSRREVKRMFYLAASDPLKEPE
jgi:glycosyltransferase involved in cell wall biosynthesis